MTQKLVTIGAILGALGLALVAVIFFYLAPAMADANLQPASKIKWDHPLHWLGMDDVLTVAKFPITMAGKPTVPVQFPRRYGALAEGYEFCDSLSGDDCVWVRIETGITPAGVKITPPGLPITTGPAKPGGVVDKGRSGFGTLAEMPITTGDARGGVQDRYRYRYGQ